MSFLNLENITEPEWQDMLDAFDYCTHNFIPELPNRAAFQNLSLYALDNVSRRFTFDFERLVNNWDMVEFATIFHELRELIEDHPRAFSELNRIIEPITQQENNGEEEADTSDEEEEEEDTYSSSNNDSNSSDEE